MLRKPSRSATRRGVIVGAFGLAVAGGTAGALTGGSGGSRIAPAPARRILPSATRGALVQVVAHPDDDVLFLGPSSQQRMPNVVTVYLTDGESSGVGHESRCVYAGSRDKGARAYHAQLAGAQNQWNVSWVRLATGTTVEVNTLASHPSVQLVFFHLHESGDSDFDNGPHAGSLYTLYGDASATPNSTLGSLHSDGAECASQSVGQSVARQSLIDSLVALFEHYAPAFIAAQDPQVATLGPQYHAHVHDPGDNSDHIGAARFVAAAASRYRGPAGDGQYLLRYYRDYNVRQEPTDVEAAGAIRKSAFFFDYLGPQTNGRGRYTGAYDPKPDPNESVFYGLFYSRLYARWPGGLALDASSGARLYTAVGDRIAVFDTTSGASAVSAAPRFISATGMAPYVIAAAGSHANSHLVGVRIDDNRILSCALRGNDAGSWDPLPADLPSGRAGFGTPVAAVGGGLLSVFTFDPGGGVRVITARPDGSWPATWVNLGGDGTRPGLGVVADADGRITLYAPTYNGVSIWRQSAPWGAFQRAPSLLGVSPTGPISAISGEHGHVLYFPSAPEGRITRVQQQANGSWSAPVVIPQTANAGDGVAVHQVQGGELVASVDQITGVATVAQFTGTPSVLFRSDAKFMLTGAPALLIDGGAATVLAMKVDGTLARWELPVK